MTIDDIEDLQKLVLVKIPDTKTNKSRSFTIVGDFYLSIFRKYKALRPTDTDIKRFFLKYQNGRCHKVVMGIHKISGVPKEIATYLKLSNPSEYTGHCLRRTSATLLVDSGEDITSLKRHGGWKSSSVAEGYIEESITNKQRIAEKILSPVDYNVPSTSTTLDYNIDDLESVETCHTSTLLENSDMNITTKLASNGFNFQNCSIKNCTFNITK